MGAGQFRFLVQMRKTGATDFRGSTRMKLEVEKGMVVLWIAAVFAVGDQAEWNLVEWVAGFVHRACTGNAER